ncbi:hypothetical protein [Stenotrophomonas sp. 278]|uniref:hypothetical protein n=1 Tax=Stenotrophomonas sp. 278 TaxID=2479851 RepID=UPI000F67F289|nr:hypothetical protein [Stenotrophomonas sp. 278]RRU05598.1 hypothetical protein EGJ34_18050 [Stenotrophomonas sp. 278]
MANIKYADLLAYLLIAPTDDDMVMFRKGDGTDGRAPLVQPKGYIDGLKLEWVSGTQIRVTPGAAYVPGPKRIAELAAAVTLTPSLSASTWYHVYLTVISGVVSAEAVTTAPASPYTGTARAKTGDTTRRYLGSFRTDGSGAIFNFIHTDDGVIYLTDISVTPFRVLANGTSTSWTTFSVANVAPVTANGLIINAVNAATGAVRVRPSLGSYVGNGRIYGLASGVSAYGPLPVDSTLLGAYMIDTGGSAVVDVVGYQYGR